MLLFTRAAYSQTLTSEQFSQVKEKLAREKDKTKKARLLLSAARYCVEKEGENRKDLDNAVWYNNQALAISRELGLKNNIAQGMLLNGWITVEGGKKKDGIALVNQALDYAVKNNLKKEQAEGHVILALDFNGDDPAKKVEHLKTAASLFRQAGAQNDEAEAYVKLATLYHDVDESQCMTYMQQAIKIKRDLKIYDLHKEYAMFAISKCVIGEFKESLHYALEAEKIAENVKADDLWLSIIYNLLGNVYARLNFDNESIAYFKKAAAVAKRSGDQMTFKDIMLNIAFKLDRLKRPAEALKILQELDYDPGKDCDIFYSSISMLVHTQLKHSDKAKPHYEKLLRCNSDLLPQEQELRCRALVEYLLLTGQAHKAYPYIDQLKKIGETNPNMIDLSELEVTYFRADSASGNFKDALVHYKKYRSLTDSVFSANRAKEFDDLLLKYETEKKDKNIKLLNSQNQLQRSRVENAEKAKNITLGGIICAGIVIALLFVLYRIKQRSNRTLEASQRELDQKNNFLEMVTTNQDRLLKEKEWLVKEVHHRVKNNLQMVTSLLYSQSVYLEDDAAKRAVKDSLRRMQAMALIHQKLYQDENTSTVAMPGYIDELLQYLRESFDAGEQIAFQQHIAQVKLDVSQAVPLGLILTESIVNAIKYAFIHEQNGMVNISLQDDGTDHLLLEISDNGVGLPADPELMERNSLGLDLMEGLAGQLGGTFTIKSENGVHIAVKFRKKN